MKAALARSRDLWIALAGTLAVIGLSLAASRGERVVSWDSFQYISLARTLVGHFPEHLGGHYPFGFPLLAAPLVAIGAHPYPALVVISVAAYAALLFVVSHAMGRDASTEGLRVFVPALGLIPAVFAFATDAMSESLFAFLVIFAAFLMTQWTRPRAIYLTALVTVLALTVRYAGIFLLPAMLAWTVYDRLTARAFPIRHALAGMALATASIAGLLYANILATGFAGGVPLVAAPHGLGTLALHLADFGFGSIGAFSSGLSARLSADARVEIAAGLACTGVQIALALAALRGRSTFAAACGVVILSYTATIVALQSVTTFADPTRYFVPVIPPLFVIVLALLRDRRWMLIGGTAALCMIAAYTVVRGTKSEMNSDLTAASAFLQPRLAPPTRVLVNIDAMSLASRLNGSIWVGLPRLEPGLGYVFMTDPENFSPRRGDYLVIATVRYERRSANPPFAQEWTRYLRANLQSGAAKLAYTNRNVIVAEFLR